MDMSREYPVFIATENYDYSFDVLHQDQVLEGGRGLKRDVVTTLLTRFAQRYGTIMVEVRMLKGRVSRDLIHSDGRVLPYYELGEAGTQVVVPLGTDLLESMEQVLLGAAAPPRAEKPAGPKRPLMATNEVLAFDVEAEMAQAKVLERSQGASIRLSPKMMGLAGGIVALVAGSAWFFLR